MTGQDWAIIGAGWLALAIVIAGFWLDQRQLAHRLDRHRAELTNHARRLILQETAPNATSIGQPMASVTGQHRAIPADRTLRLARPPALSDIEHALTRAGRGLTGVEIAQAIGVKPWELLPALDRHLQERRVVLTGGHTLGRSTYELPADTTLRLPSGMVAGHG